MSAPKLAQSLANLRRALDRLGEALAESPANALVVDGTIQRFEFAIELTWKAMRRALALEGVETTTPRSTLKQAYAAGWIDDEAAWLQMLQDRNETSHIYDEDMARRIYASIRLYYPLMEAAYGILAGRNS